jgi:hypothetical protein
MDFIYVLMILFESFHKYSTGREPCSPLSLPSSMNCVRDVCAGTLGGYRQGIYPEPPGWQINTQAGIEKLLLEINQEAVYYFIKDHIAICDQRKRL